MIGDHHQGGMTVTMTTQPQNARLVGAYARTRFCASVRAHFCGLFGVVVIGSVVTKEIAFILLQPQAPTCESADAK
jgi:hypothetical protein